MYGFTGTWQGTPVSVQGSGMGQPSMSIYVNELFQEYDVQQVVRVGSCGAVTDRLALRDVVIASGGVHRLLDEPAALPRPRLRAGGRLRPAARGRRRGRGARRRDQPRRPDLLRRHVLQPAPGADGADGRPTACSPWRWRPARSTRWRRRTAARRWRSARSATTSSPARRPPQPSASRPSARWSTSRWRRRTERAALAQPRAGCPARQRRTRWPGWARAGRCRLLGIRTAWTDVLADDAQVAAALEDGHPVAVAVDDPAGDPVAADVDPDDHALVLGPVERVPDREQHR